MIQIIITPLLEQEACLLRQHPYQLMSDTTLMTHLHQGRTLYHQTSFHDMIL